MKKHNRDRRRMMALLRIYKKYPRAKGGPITSIPPVSTIKESYMLTLRLPPEMLAWVNMND